LRRKEILAIFFVCLAAFLLGALTLRPVLKHLESTGRIITLGIECYSEPECINKLTLINWTDLIAGYTYNYTIYLRNEGNSPVTLEMWSQNWEPDIAVSYFNLTWNYNGSVINPQEVREIVLYLETGYPTEFVEFSFEIVIQANKV